MACSSRDIREAGFATSAAMVASMSLAMVAAALAAAGVAELKRAQGEHGKLEARYALEAAQRLAALEILQDGIQGRLSWSLEGPHGPVRILAEPESIKASLEAAGKDDDRGLERFGVSNPSALGARLADAEFARADQAWIETLAASPLWRGCANSMISRFGLARKLELTASAQPDRKGFSWRPGEVWRVRASLAGGWTDDRVVRFTGDALQPTATIERRVMRTNGEEATCAQLMTATP